VIESKALLSDLRELVRTLETDLRGRVETEPSRALEAAWRTARESGRAALSHGAWLDDHVNRAACAWVLATVFARFCEDNQLIEAPFLAAPGSRLSLAIERQQAYFGHHPERTGRDWIVAALDGLSTSAAAVRLFDDLHGIMQELPISHDAAKELIAFWRRLDGTGRLIHDFTDPDLGTGFLADLYANLSDYSRMTYALVQTPTFVADLILDRTLGPALDAYGRQGLRVIDPVCGSGTFLLGAFARLLEARHGAAPDAGPWHQVRQVLSSIHGVDKNPLAAVICRFRLLIAAITTAGASRLAEVPELPLIVATGDSLVPHDAMAHGIHEDLGGYASPAVNLLGAGSYDAVVGNPPYITVRDRAENELYRSIYAVCRGRYSLTIPFIVRFFGLARSAGDRAGFVGMLVSNGFMKREFGRLLVEEFLPTVDLTHVIDTSGAYIPGHGTPTAILLGLARPPRADFVRSVRGGRGEPSQPRDPAAGLVWQAITGQLDRPGSESEWVTVTDTDRGRFAKHPWSLTGSGAGDLLAKLEAGPRLGPRTIRVGYYAATGADDAYLAAPDVFRRVGAEDDPMIRVVTGSEVRDWAVTARACAFFPGADAAKPIDITRFPGHMRRLWPYRTTLRNRPSPLRQLQIADHRAWYGWHQVTARPGTHPWSLIFPWVATHQHFAVLREGIGSLQSAPVVKLPRDASQDEFFRLAAALNSSAACFWLKQYSQSKGAPKVDQLRAEEPWEQFREFTSTTLEKLPLPAELSPRFGRELDALARRMAAVEPSAVCAQDVPTRKLLDAARDERERIRGQMIALQEELDWDIYRRYGLLDHVDAGRLIASPEVVPELKLGERAFEIVMARLAEKGQLETQWFARHMSTPITEIPDHWPQVYREVVARRIEVIENDRTIGLIEQPEYKRRWQSEPWESKERAALTSWLLSRSEDRSLWYEPSGRPRPLTIIQLADQLNADADVVLIARMLAGSDANLADVLREILDEEHVPYLAQLRYRGEGVVKRSLWERTWELQRAEDKAGAWRDIPAPPAYRSTDFAKNSYWRHRGKLDVPKERFISYPLASPDNDGSLLLGWAGWNQLEQSLVLITLIEERSNADGWGSERIAPLLAGLAEAMPWVRQWHSDVDPTYGTSPADACESYLTALQEKYGLSDNDIRAWRAPPVRRGRPPKARATATERDAGER